MNRRPGAARILVLAPLTGLFITGGWYGASASTPPTPPTDTAITATEAAPSAFPVTVTSCGREYTYTRAPERVVVGSPTSIETLAGLGVEDAAVGYTAGDFGPPPAGGAAELSGAYLAPREVLLDADPDLLLVNAEIQVTGGEGTVSYADLEQVGANVYVLGEYCQDSPGDTGVDAVYQDITNIGAIFGVPERAADLIADLEHRVAIASDLRGDREPPRTAYVQIFDGDLYALAGAGYAAALDAVGAINVFADIEENFALVSPEAVLRLDADAIVFVYDFTGDEAAARTEVETVLAGTAAVDNGVLVGVPSYLPEGAGVTVVDIIELIARGLYE